MFTRSGHSRLRSRARGDLDPDDTGEDDEGLMMIAMMMAMKGGGCAPFAVKTKASAEWDRVVASLRPAPSSLGGL